MADLGQYSPLLGREVSAAWRKNSGLPGSKNRALGETIAQTFIGFQVSSLLSFHSPYSVIPALTPEIYFILTAFVKYAQSNFVKFYPNSFIYLHSLPLFFINNNR